MYIEIDKSKLENKIYEMLTHFMLENPEELTSYHEAYGCLMTTFKDIRFSCNLIEAEIDSLGYVLMDNSGKKDKPDNDGVTPMEHKLQYMNDEVTDLIKMAMVCKVYLHKAYALAVAKKNEYEENEEKPTETEKTQEKPNKNPIKTQKPKETQETERNERNQQKPKETKPTEEYPSLPNPTRIVKVRKITDEEEKMIASLKRIGDAFEKLGIELDNLVFDDDDE